MIEEWKDVVGYEGLYMVSNYGNVISLKYKKRRLLKFNLNGSGYYQVDLYKDGKRNMKRVHILVSESFFQHKPNKGHDIVVNHINGNPLDNRLENLELTTQSVNVRKGAKCKNTSSKYVGVSWYKQYSKWKASVYKNGRHHHVGYYENEHDAHLAIKKWEVEFDEQGKLKLV